MYTQWYWILENGYMYIYISSRSICVEWTPLTQAPYQIMHIDCAGDIVVAWQYIFANLFDDLMIWWFHLYMYSRVMIWWFDDLMIWCYFCVYPVIFSMYLNMYMLLCMLCACCYSCKYKVAWYNNNVCVICVFKYLHDMMIWSFTIFARVSVSENILSIKLRKYM